MEVMLEWRVTWACIDRRSSDRASEDSERLCQGLGDNHMLVEAGNCSWLLVYSTNKY